MYLREATTGHLVEVLDLHALMDPHRDHFDGRYHWGEEAQDAESFGKSDLVFPSGEPLPRCWCNPHYRDHELRR